MQALKQPDSGGGHPGAAVARSQWRRIFYLLTAFNIVTIGGALYLAYRLLTREVIGELSLLIQEKGHELSTSGGSESLPLLTDPKLLREVLVNLISNAIKYTPPGGRISIGKTCGKAGL